MTCRDAKEVIKREILRIVQTKGTPGPEGPEMVYHELERELLKSPAVAAAMEMLRLTECEDALADLREHAKPSC